MGLPIYCDLDETLAYSIWEGPEGHETLVDFVIRPGAADFLRRLSDYGTPFILTLSDQDYARDAVARIGSDLVAGIIARQDLEPVIEEIYHVFAVAPNRVWTAQALQRLIPPILPKGPIIDDRELGSAYQIIKSVATGTPASWWIQVPSFARMNPDQDGLGKVLEVLEIRMGGARELAGREVRVQR